MRFGRNCIFDLLLIMVLVLPMWSCIWDDADCAGADAVTEGDRYGYFTVSIIFSDDGGSMQSRAMFDGSGNVQDKGYFFNNGIEEESRISGEDGANWLLAYDAQGAIVATLQLGTFYESSSTDNTGKSYKALCRVPAESNFLNGVEDLRIILNAGTALQQVVGSGSVSGDVQISQSSAGSTDYLFSTSGSGSDAVRYNTMSSSIVVNGNEAVTAITMNDIRYYPTPEQALESPCATLYVERLQSKYTVLFRPGTNVDTERYFFDNKVWNYNPATEQSEESSDKAIVFTPVSTRRIYYVNEFNVENDTPVTSRGSWKASIVGWNINGTEPSTYLFKSFGTSPSSFAKWNFIPTEFSSPVRNLWASDPHYSNGKGIYPDQYRGAWDTYPANSDVNAQRREVNPYEQNEQRYPLNYLSFNTLAKREIRQYSAENTYDAEVVFDNKQELLDDRLQYRCGNHLVIGAQLLISGMDDDDIYNPSSVDGNGLIVSGNKRVKTKYFMNNIYWAEAAYVNYYSKELAKNLNAVTPCYSDLTRQSGEFVPNDVFAPANGETKFYVREGNTYRPADYRDFTIEPVYIIGGDGWCYPRPSKDPSNESNTCLFVLQQNGYHQITFDEYDKFAYGYPFYFAKCYNEGRMYYAVPITNNESRANTSDFGLQTGDCGAVRNHWYHFRFTELTSVGVSVHRPDQPIVPNNEPSVLGLGFEVRIIPWHLVEEDVDI